MGFKGSVLWWTAAKELLKRALWEETASAEVIANEIPEEAAQCYHFLLEKVVFFQS